MTPSKAEEIGNCIEISSEHVDLLDVNSCLRSGSDMVASRFVAGNMMILVKTDDEMVFKNSVFNFE
jgi:hypothetical protein